ADIFLVYVDGNRCGLNNTAVEEHQPGIAAREARGIERNELAFASILASHSNQRRSARRGDKHEIEAHVLAELTKLVFHGAARIHAARVVDQELYSGFKRGVFASYFKKTAVFEIAAGLHLCYCNLTFAQ